MKQLSKREKQVIGLISTGETSKMIAKRLGISIRTVDAHRSHIMQKYNVKKCEHAVRVAIELGDIVLSSKSVNYLIERDKLTKDIIKAVDDHLAPTGVYDLDPHMKVIGCTGESPSAHVYTFSKESNK